MAIPRQGRWRTVVCDVTRCAERLRWSALGRREHKTPVAPKESDLVLPPTKKPKEESGLPVKLPLQGRRRDALVETRAPRNPAAFTL